MNIHHIYIYTPLLLVTEAFIHVMLSYLRTTPKIGRQFCNPSATLLAVDTCLPVENSPQYQGDESQDSTSFLERTFGRGNTFWVYIFERTQGGNGKKYEEVMPYCFVWLFGLYSQLSEMFCLPNLLVSVCTPNHGQNLTVQVDVFSKYIGPIDSWTFRHGRSGYLAYLEFSKQPAGFGIVWMSFWAGFCLLLKVPSFQNGPFRMMNS